MIELLLANWKWVVMVALSAALGTTWHLYRAKAADFEEYKVEVQAQGKIAQEAAKAQEAKQNQIVKDVSDAWNAQIEPTRKAAVAAYLARHGTADVRHSASDGVLYHPGSGSVPGQAGCPQGTDAAGPQCLPDAALIADCAQDALTLRLWQEWATRNGLPIE